MLGLGVPVGMDRRPSPGRRRRGSSPAGRRRCVGVGAVGRLGGRLGGGRRRSHRWCRGRVGGVAAGAWRGRRRAVVRGACRRPRRRAARGDASAPRRWAVRAASCCVGCHAWVLLVGGSRCVLGYSADRCQPVLRVDSCQRPTATLPSHPKSVKTTMPSSDGEDQRAVHLRVLVAAAGTAPSGCRCPLSPRRKNSSPTTAPMTDRPAAMRNPVKIAGIAAGNCSLRSRVQPAGAAQREQVVLADVGRQQTEQRVRRRSGRTRSCTQTSTRDVQLVAEQQRDDRHDRRGSGSPAGPRGTARASARATAPATSSTASAMPTTIAMREPDERGDRGPPEARRACRPRIEPFEERVVDDRRAARDEERRLVEDVRRPQ